MKNDGFATVVFHLLAELFFKLSHFSLRGLGNISEGEFKPHFIVFHLTYLAEGEGRFYA